MRCTKALGTDPRCLRDRQTDCRTVEQSELGSTIYLFDNLQKAKKKEMEKEEERKRQLRSK